MEFLNVKNNIKHENSEYIDIYSLNNSNKIENNIRLAIVYPYDDVYLNLESRIYKLQYTNNACEPNQLNFVRLDTVSNTTNNTLSVLCLNINISDMVNRMSEYRTRLYRIDDTTDIVSFLTSSGYFSYTSFNV